MKRILSLFIFLSVVSSVMAEQPQIVGLWSNLGIGRQTNYFQFTEDGKCSSWYIIVDSEIGMVREHVIEFQDCPYTFDEETLTVTVTIGERVWNCRFECITDNLFRINDDNHTTYTKGDYTFNQNDYLGIETLEQDIAGKSMMPQLRYDIGGNVASQSSGLFIERGKVVLKK